MTTRVAINGFGRIGRSFTRAILVGLALSCQLRTSCCAVMSISWMRLNAPGR